MFENPRRGRQARNIYCNKSSENSRSQIIFRTDIFRKLTLDAPAGSLTRAVVEKLLVIFVIYFIAHSSVFQVKRLALRLPRKRLQIEYTPKRGSNE